MSVKIIQFGTGVFLRGFVADFVQRANNEFGFDGQILTVKSTTQGSLEVLEAQQNRYHLIKRGLVNGQSVEDWKAITSWQKIVNAQTDWPKVLQAAADPNVRFVISNTTEVGLQYKDDDITDLPPLTYPGKLAALLAARYRALRNRGNEGRLVIIPCELLSNNGDLLRHSVTRMLEYNKQNHELLRWVNEQCMFVNSLVDRIVTGLATEEEMHRFEAENQVKEKALINAEIYGLWALEGGEVLQHEMQVFGNQPEIVVAGTIEKFREQKLRILNGFHTFLAPLAFFADVPTVREAIEHPILGPFLHKLCFEELVPTLPYEDSAAFAQSVIDRFKNPYIDHQVINITLQATIKMKMRNLASLRRFDDYFSKVPRRMALSFAALMLFARPTDSTAAGVSGMHGKRMYPINDEKNGYWAQHWLNFSNKEDYLAFAKDVLADEDLWGEAIEIDGLAEEVAFFMNAIATNGLLATLEEFETNA